MCFCHDALDNTMSVSRRQVPCTKNAHMYECIWPLKQCAFDLDMVCHVVYLTSAYTLAAHVVDTWKVSAEA